MEQEAKSAQFYQDLPVLDNFKDALDPANLHLLPDDWYFMITDVVNSSTYLEQANYRKINMAGAGCLTAVLNAIGRIDIPYVFCGDGAQLACPGTSHRLAFRALHSMARRAKRLYGMDLRVAGFKVGTLREAGYTLHVGKVALSPKVNQAVFLGNGLEAIDYWIREGTWALERPSNLTAPDLTGLECRWKEVPTSRDEILNLLILAGPGNADSCRTYRRVLDLVDKTLGHDHERIPLEPSALKLMMKLQDQKDEVNFRHHPATGWKLSLHSLWNIIENHTGAFLMSQRLKFLGIDWGRYFDEIFKHSDHQKFNGMLALMAGTSTGSRQELVSHLEEAFLSGELAYGFSISQTSLITCMVLERNGRHLHFVDGSAGGYAQASRDLKKRLAMLTMKS